MNVAVLGGGIMGNGIAQIAATVGDDAVVRDLDEAALERARAAIETSLGRFVKKERLTADEAGAVLGRIRFTTDMEAALSGADVVIEAVPEVLDLKRSVWEAVGELAPEHALLGTNTSQLSITSIAVALGRQAPRLVGIHFFNPPVMMRLCEVIAGTETPPEEVERACEFGRHVGKEVVVCRKDSPGFITSRAYAILRLECIRMLEEGVASARRHRHGAEARVQLPDGAARARRHERPRHVPARGHGPGRGSRRSLPADSRPAQHGGGKSAGP